MPASPGGDAAAWLVLVYRLPAAPGALKLRVHRNLTAAGAVYLSSACALAPAGSAERVMRRIRAMIGDAGGSAVLLRANALSGGQEIIAALEGARDREYDDVIARCRDGAGALAAMTEARDFSYQELSEHDARLKGLDTRFRAVGGGQQTSKGREAASALARYGEALDEYAKSVYAADSG